MRKPDMEGVGRAWVVTSRASDSDTKGTLKAWLITGPWHVAWTYWLVSVIHLRDIPGVPKAVIHVEGAEHEFLIISLESPPTSKIVPDPDDIRTFRYLTPIDLGEQYAGLTDEQAIEICDLMVRAIMQGQASPDQDWRSWWRGSLDVTVQHVREGKHGGHR